MSINKEIARGLTTQYRKLKNFYDFLHRDPELSLYKDNFSFTDVIDKVYAVGPYCWFVSDMHTAKFLKIGGAIHQMTGYTAEEFTDVSFIQAGRFTNPEHLSGVLNAAEHYWNYFYSQSVDNRVHIKASFTYEFIRKDGSTFHALQQGTTIFFDKQGNGVYQFDLITDITHLDPKPQLRFYLMDTSIPEEMKNIALHQGLIVEKKKLPISKAEKKVLELIAQGKSIKVIAHELGISDNTVKHHRTSMFAKCNVKNMAELTAKALEYGGFD
jgi:DNA-binding CsgD family transcriptional regulator